MLPPLEKFDLHTLRSGTSSPEEPVSQWRGLSTSTLLPSSVQSLCPLEGAMAVTTLQAAVH